MAVNPKTPNAVRRNPAKVVSIDAGNHRRDVIARRNALVEQHIHLVPAIAQRLCRLLPPSFEMDDLIAVGNLAMVHAANRYRPKAHGGAPFSAFARKIVRGAMIETIRRRHFVENTRPGLDDIEEPAMAQVIDISIDRERHLKKIRSAMGYLDARRKHVLDRYYSDDLPLFEEVGRELGLSRTHTNILHSSAIRELRGILHVG